MKVQFVKKRDGRIVPFDSQRIRNAIRKAMAASESGIVDEKLIVDVTGDVVKAVESECSSQQSEVAAVDRIHDLVEEYLMRSSRLDAAKEYIRFRHQRNIARKAPTMDIFKSIVDAQANEITRENANMNADTPAGMMMKFASEASKTFVDEVLLSEEAAQYVKANLIHIHDKDYYPTRSLTCLQMPLNRPLNDGFVDGHASVRPSKRIETAATIACIALEAVQNRFCSLR